MADVFTRYVQFPSGEHTEGFNQAVRRILIGQMRRRGLYSSSPRFLGMVEWQSWETAALDELTAQARLWLIKRIPFLKGRLQCKEPKIESNIRLMLADFLTTLQKKFDPIGYRIYEMVRAAVDLLIRRECLIPGGGEERIRNDTLLAVSHEAALEYVERDMSDHAAKWNDDLLVALLTADGKEKDKAVRSLADRVQQLPDQGVRAFRFKDLADAMKKDGRKKRRSPTGQDSLPSRETFSS